MAGRSSKSNNRGSSLSGFFVSGKYKEYHTAQFAMTFKVSAVGLVLYLDASNANSYSGSGTAWNDLSGNSNNATLINGPTYSTDNGGAIVFDGGNDYSPLESSQFPTGSSAGTMSCWAKTDTINSGFRWVFSYGTAGTGLTRALGIQDNAYKFAGYASDVNATSVPLNTWFNMVGVYDTNGQASLYINGSLAAGPTSLNWNTSSGNAQIGRQTNNNEYWDGSIAQILVYDRALTASEVLTNYNTFKSRFGH